MSTRAITPAIADYGKFRRLLMDARDSTHLAELLRLARQGGAK